MESCSYLQIKLKIKNKEIKEWKNSKDNLPPFFYKKNDLSNNTETK
jgi:hypothetical protein